MLFFWTLKLKEAIGKSGRVFRYCFWTSTFGWWRTPGFRSLFSRPLEYGSAGGWAERWMDICGRFELHPGEWKCEHCIPKASLARSDWTCNTGPHGCFYGFRMSSLDATGEASGSSVWKLLDSNPCGYSGHLPRHFFRESWGDIATGEQCISPVLVTYYCAAYTLQIPCHMSSRVCCLTHRIKWLLFLWAKHLGAQEDDMRQILADSRLFKASPVQLPVHAGQLCCETWKTNQEIQRVKVFQ